MIIQEPIKAAIRFALDNFAYADAIFLSERLHAEVETDESLYLLALSYYRSGKPNATYAILSEKHTRLCCKSPQCLFLLAKCCFELKKYGEARTALTSPFHSNRPLVLDNFAFNPVSREQLIGHYGEQASFVAQLLGSVYLKLDNTDLASHYFTMSLKINPLLWCSFEKLMQLDPTEVDPAKLITGDNFEFKYSCGSNPLISLLNSSPSTDATTTSNNNSSPLKQSYQTPEANQARPTAVQIATPYALIKQSADQTLDVITPEDGGGTWKTMICLAPSKTTRTLISNRAAGALKSLNNYESNTGSNGGPVVVNRNLFQGEGSSSSSVEVEPSRSRLFGVLQLDQQSLDQLTSGMKESTNKREATSAGGSPAAKKPAVRRNIHQDVSNIAQSPGYTLRRSTRLYSNTANAVKENTKVVTPKARTPIKPRPIDSEQDQKLEEKGLLDFSKAGYRVQRASALGLLDLLGKMAIAYKHLSEYQCRQAIEQFVALPPNHAATGFVLSCLGRAYFELAKYDEAIERYSRLRTLEPYRLAGVEYYSTALWHQKKEKELSTLAQLLTQFDKQAAETWCVAGNCFSLQLDHETAIKLLKRAVQVNPDCAYAYTLLGHEHFALDEQEAALTCYRTAIRLDARHYNAWCGIALVYYQQEKWPQAYHHYQRALDISPTNPLLMCHLGIVCDKMKRSEMHAKRSLELMDRALELDPDNALVRYHRAAIYAKNKHYDLAMDELEKLKRIAPRESRVYFLIGKIHKIRGDTHLALTNFAWSMDLDPNGASKQIKELMDAQYYDEDGDEPTTNQFYTSNSNITPENSALRNRNSAPSTGRTTPRVLGDSTAGNSAVGGGGTVSRSDDIELPIEDDNNFNFSDEEEEDSDATPRTAFGHRTGRTPPSSPPSPPRPLFHPAQALDDIHHWEEEEADYAMDSAFDNYPFSWQLSGSSSSSGGVGGDGDGTVNPENPEEFML